MKFMKYLLSVLVSLILSINLAIAEKWDMALAYGAGNFHSANAAEFAKNVTEKSGGKLTIVTHPGGSLFKGGETSKKYSNKLMQLRVLLQFIAIIALVAFAYFFKN